jgi:hypothetical protein
VFRSNQQSFQDNFLQELGETATIHTLAYQESCGAQTERDFPASSVHPKHHAWEGCEEAFIAHLSSKNFSSINHRPSKGRLQQRWQLWISKQ